MLCKKIIPFFYLEFCVIYYYVFAQVEAEITTNETPQSTSTSLTRSSIPATSNNVEYNSYYNDQISGRLLYPPNHLINV